MAMAGHHYSHRLIGKAQWRTATDRPPELHRQGPCSVLAEQASIELATYAETPWSLTLWDLWKFDDSIGIAALAAVAQRRSFPRRFLALLLMQCQAPRVIRVGQAFSEWVIPIDSIVAGCGAANDMARCATYDLAEQISGVSARAELGQFVDDQARPQAAHGTVQASNTSRARGFGKARERPNSSCPNWLGRR